MKNLTDASKDEQRKFLNSFDYVLCDMDGVIWTKYQVHKGAVACMNTLKALGKCIHYVTNNSIENSEELVTKLRLNKFEVNDADVTNPQFTVIDYLKEINFQGSLYALVTENFKDQLRKAGFNLAPMPEHPLEESIGVLTKNIQDDPNVKGVLLGMDFNGTFLKFQKALTYLKRDDCIFLTSGLDMVIPLGSLGPIIGAGNFAKVVSNVSNREPTNISKPSVLSCVHVNKKLGIRTPGRALFIGDSISQDMQMAAMGGYQKLLVFSGHAQLKDIENWAHPEEWKPQYYIEDLNAFYNVIKGLDIDSLSTAS
nr:unnamed protein product [Callosobruchus analis]